jgi:hypothetical protein
MDTLAEAAAAQRPSPTDNARRRSARPRVENRQFRGLTCANCRARKIRCGGGQPSCKTCEIYNDECRYDKAPPMSQVMAMARRLQEAEETIANLRTRTEGNPHSRPSLSSQQAASAPTARPSHCDFFPVPELGMTPGPSGTVPTRDPAALGSVGQPASPLSVDGNGGIQYYGPTSAVHDPLQRQPESSITQASSASQEYSSRTDIRSTLRDYAEESRIWEEFALGNASLQTGIPRHIIAKLLHVHWTWVSPMFMYVYRPGECKHRTLEQYMGVQALANTWRPTSLSLHT